MKQIQKLKNQELVDDVVKLVGEERRIGIEILEYLQEIERRKVYSELGCESLFMFCVKHLKYSEAQASRRVSAMWALKELPELKSNIQTGKLTITTVAQMQSHLRQKKLEGTPVNREEKLQLFASIQDQSSEEVKKTILELQGEEAKLKLILELDPEMAEAWDMIKNLSAHSTRGQSNQILNMLMKEWLKKNDPTIQRAASETKKTDEKLERSLGARNTSASGEAVRQPIRRTLPASVRRHIWARDRGQCQKCESKFAVQIDHIRPFAKGGVNSPDNLRLLCRSCNLYRGIREFGTDRMNRLR